MNHGSDPQPVVNLADEGGNFWRKALSVVKLEDEGKRVNWGLLPGAFPSPILNVYLFIYFFFFEMLLRRYTTDTPEARLLAAHDKMTTNTGENKEETKQQEQ